jgi:hypothetical protein
MPKSYDLNCFIICQDLGSHRVWLGDFSVPLSINGGGRLMALCPAHGLRVQDFFTYIINALAGDSGRLGSAETVAYRTCMWPCQCGGLSVCGLQSCSESWDQGRS